MMGHIDGVLEDGDGTEVTIAHGKEVKFVEGQERCLGIAEARGSGFNNGYSNHGNWNPRIVGVNLYVIGMGTFPSASTLLDDPSKTTCRCLCSKPGILFVETSGFTTLQINIISEPPLFFYLKTFQ